MAETVTEAREIDELFEHTVEDNRLFLEGKQGRGLIHPESETRFSMKEPQNVRVEFAKRGDRVTELVIDRMGLRETRATRLESD